MEQRLTDLCLHVMDMLKKNNAEEKIARWILYPGETNEFLFVRILKKDYEQVPFQWGKYGGNKSLYSIVLTFLPPDDDLQCDLALGLFELRVYGGPVRHFDWLFIPFFIVGRRKLLCRRTLLPCRKLRFFYEEKECSFSLTQIILDDGEVKSMHAWLSEHVKDFPDDSALLHVLFHVGQFCKPLVAIIYRYLHRTQISSPWPQWHKRYYR